LDYKVVVAVVEKLFNAQRPQMLCGQPFLFLCPPAFTLYVRKAYTVTEEQTKNSGSNTNCGVSL